jgi:hypothetical protein
MLRAHILHRTVVSCPACCSGEYDVSRRLPADQGRVVNRCSCRRCGLYFEFVEDRAGHPVGARIESPSRRSAPELSSPRL